MRIKITFNRTGRQRMLPMDYQYYISAWIYKVIRNADEEFADFLHNTGYGEATKPYKLFCFDRLNFGKPKLWKDKKLFEIRQDTLELNISFDIKEVASNFIKGLFMDQAFFLGNRFNGIDLKVVQVAVLEEPDFKETMHYRLNSPWVVSYKTEEDRYPQYLSPSDDRFLSLAEKHIKEKAKNIHGVTDAEIRLKILSDSKRAGFRIKPDTKEESRVVGNLFEFELMAPIAVHKMIYGAGISEKSATGFGWVEMTCQRAKHLTTS